MASDEDEPVIHYTVKDLLMEMRHEMTAEFRRLFERLDGKADKSDVAALAAKYEAMDGRLQTVETAQAHQTEHSEWRTEWRRWLIPTVLTAAFLVVSLLQLVIGGGNRG